MTDDIAAERLHTAMDLLQRTQEIVSSVVASLKTKTQATLKNSHGKLTDAGVSAVYAAFEGGMSVQDVAKKFDIHESAAWARKQSWKKAFAAKKK